MVDGQVGEVLFLQQPLGKQGFPGVARAREQNYHVVAKPFLFQSLVFQYTTAQARPLVYLFIFCDYTNKINGLPGRISAGERRNGKTRAAAGRDVNEGDSYAAAAYQTQQN